MLDLVHDIIVDKTTKPEYEPRIVPVNVVKEKYHIQPMKIKPESVLSKPLTFPRYYASGNGVDAWEVDILHGKGRVHTLTRYHDERIAAFIGKRETKAKAIYLYENLRRSALKELKRLQEEEPLHG